MSVLGLTLALSPSGRLSLSGLADGAWIKRVVAGFEESSAAGLFALAARRPDEPPAPELNFFRGFAERYLHALCRSPEGQVLEDIPPPPDLDDLALGAPPLSGGEYLSAEVFESLWRELDAWVRARVAESEGGLGAWLAAEAPLWRQVGRVCLHLAEHKADPLRPFAFLATYAPGLSQAGQVQYQPLARALEEYAGARNKEALVRLLSPIHKASESVALIQELVESREIFRATAWTAAEAYQLLTAADRLEDAGLLLRLPDWWRKRPRPRVSVTIGEQKRSYLNADSLLDFRVSVALGDEELSAEELEELLAGGEDGLVLIKGRWVEVDRERLQAALQHWRGVQRQAGRDGIAFLEGMRLLAGASAGLEAEDEADPERSWSRVKAGPWLSETLAELRRPGEERALKASRAFKGTLRPYQRAGHNWLFLAARLGLGVCLADDMGLGKTVQVLSVLLALKKKGARPSLLILPASLLGNWRAEKERFAPSLKTCFYHSSQSDKTSMTALQKDPAKALSGLDLVVTTYGMVARRPWLAERDWRFVILDEAQAIKNPGTRQTRAVKKLRSEGRFALTGTPVENRLGDLWSLFDFLCPGLLGSAKRFKGFVQALGERTRDPYAPLRRLVQPYILRRLKTDRRVIDDLPDKTEMKVYCGLSKKQVALYGQAVAELAQAVKTLKGIERRGLVLATLMRLKQICNHPSQLLGDGVYKPAYSGKWGRLRAIAEELASRQEKALIFTQFRELTAPLASFLAEAFGREGLVLHGGTPVKKRAGLIERFQSPQGPPFFVLSLKAGGTGLNLTAASHVVHFDRWWNPAVENQATDRAFRIGQERKVLVHKFICQGTLEERIDGLIEEKTKLAEELLMGGGESILTEMSDAELLRTVALDLERAGL